MRTSSLGVVLGLSCVFALAESGCREPTLANPPAGLDGGGASGGGSGRGGGGGGGSGGLSGTGGSSGSGGSVFVDARPETSVAPDGSGEAAPASDGPTRSPADGSSAAAADAPLLPDAPAAVVMVSSCDQLNCPQLTALATECAVDETTSCESDLVSSTESNYCHDNDVKKHATRVFSGANYTTTMLVTKPSGSDCYTLVMSGSENGNLETWVFKSPAGAEVARGEWNNDLDQLTLICGGTRYVIGQVGCPGTDGEPSEDECEEGDCEID